MKKLVTYLRSAFSNIINNRAYAAFCILGTALTFVFIILLLQLAHVITGDEPPLTHAKRTINIFEWDFQDKQGNMIYVKNTDVGLLSGLIKGKSAFAYSNIQAVNLELEGSIKSVGACFVNEDYWKVKNFEFIEGKPFKDGEYSMPVAVIKESNARKYFGNKSPLGKAISFQGNTYKIIGMVKNFSFLTNELAGIWVPYIYDKFVPNSLPAFRIDCMFPEDMPVGNMKVNVAEALNHYYRLRNINVDITPEQLPTLHEKVFKNYSGNLLTYGLGVAIFLLLIIPAINIVTLSVANTNLRSEEMAIRRSVGATKWSVFVQLMTENLMLVLTGTIMGIFLTYPVIRFVDKFFIGTSSVVGATLLGEMNYWIIVIYVVPLSVLFSLLSGGVPSYLIAKKNISETLKSDSK